MIFKYKTFIDDLKENPEKETIISDYQKLVEPIFDDLRDQIWYKEYVSKFKNIPIYNVPEELSDDFDWQLLFQLLSASFSSNISLSVENDKEKPDLNITVTSGDQVTTKKISELWGFQILRLFEIYIEEMLNLEILRANDEIEKQAIDTARISKINRHTNRFSIVSAEKNNPISEDLIYHYTTIDGFYNILKNKSIFLTDLRYLNDRLELIHGIKVVKNKIEILSKQRNTSEENALNTIYSEIERIQDFQIFAASFSFEPDLLSQWRAYGDNGKGICIGFDRKTLDGIMLEENNLFGFPIYYEDSKIMEDVLKLKNNIVEFINPDNLNSATAEIHKMFQSSSIYEKISQLIYQIKHPSFKEEKEYRYAGVLRENLNMKLRLSNNYLKPYISASIEDKDGYCPIRRIIIGPVSDKKLMRASLDIFFKSENLNDVSIIESTIPYKG